MANLKNWQPDTKRLTNGIWSYLDGAPRDANPHPKDSFEHDLWDDDWAFQAKQAERVGIKKTA